MITKNVTTKQLYDHLKCVTISFTLKWDFLNLMQFSFVKNGLGGS